MEQVLSGSFNNRERQRDERLCKKLYIRKTVPDLLLPSLNLALNTTISTVEITVKL